MCFFFSLQKNFDWSFCFQIHENEYDILVKGVKIKLKLNKVKDSETLFYEFTYSLELAMLLGLSYLCQTRVSVQVSDLANFMNTFHGFGSELSVEMSTPHRSFEYLT